MRVGIGVDAHRFDISNSQRPLWLAGYRWIDDEREGAVGLVGESDGDVAIHALIDALLSASGCGDIGTVFGVGVSSRGVGMHGQDMLSEVVALLHRHHWAVENATLAIVGNKPKIARHRHEAEHILSHILLAPVAITATTTDGMGFTGRGEGVACTANVLLRELNEHSISA